MPAPVCFTMDNLGDAADMGRGLIQRPRQPGNRPALEQGFPAMLDLFDSFGVAITHFIEGWNGEVHPDEVRALVRRGHALGMHGWQHETWSQLDPEQSRALARRATLALEAAAGIRPLAFRAPGGARTPFTAGMLEDLGYRIDASLPPEGGGEAGIHRLGAGLWSVPYHWEHVDASHWLWENRSCAEVEARWLGALEQAAHDSSPLVFIWHPHIMGIDAARRRVGRNILARACGDSRFTVLGLEALVTRQAAGPAAPDPVGPGGGK